MTPNQQGRVKSGPGTSEVPTALFLGRLYAGHETRFQNLQMHTAHDARINGRFEGVKGWNSQGLIERMSVLPQSIRGRMRAFAESASLATFDGDLIWTSVIETGAPFLLSRLRGRSCPLVLDLDSTTTQLESMAPLYFKRKSKTGAHLALSLFLERCVWQRTSRFLPWSEWAASSLRNQGVPAEKITVLPPGIDLLAWQPSNRTEIRGGPLRLLFVGGDFYRKGGDLLLETMESGLLENLELDIVTRDSVQVDSSKVRIHRAEPNSVALRQLYAQADVFILPTRAECFGISAIEAMAAGLPVIMSDVGGASDIVKDGETGWLIRPTIQSLRDVLGRVTNDRSRLIAMGVAGRARAEARFDGQVNDRRIVDILLEALGDASETR